MEKTYPKRTPPKATKRPIMIAGAAEPTASSGFFKAKPMMTRRGRQKDCTADRGMNIDEWTREE